MPPVVTAVAVAISKIGVAIVSTLGFSAGVQAVVGNFLLRYGVALLMAGGSVAYSRRQMSKMKRAMSSGIDQGRSVMVRDPIAPRRIIYGQVPVSGPIPFMHVAGSNNEYLYLIVKLADHECEELGTIYLDQDEVPLDGSGDATGKYAGYFQCRKYVGAAAGHRDTVWESEISGVWTENHLGCEVARLHVRLKHSPDLFPNGLPTIKCMVKGRKVWDFRTEEYAWSANAALCTADYLMDAKYGRGVPLARIRADEVIAAANICDEEVTLADASTEARYTVNGVITSDEDRDDVLYDLKEAMAGAITEPGGLWTLRAGAWRTPVMALGDEDLCGSFSVTPRTSLQNTFNGVRGLYYSPQNEWAPADFPAVIRRIPATGMVAGTRYTIVSLGTTDFTDYGADENVVGHTFTADAAGTGTGEVDPYMAQDGGTRLWADVAFRFTTSPATAQRLAKIKLERARQQIVASADYKLKAIQLVPSDNAEITRSRLGWSGKYFEVDSWRFKIAEDAQNPTLKIGMVLRETAPAVFDWDDGEETAVDLAPNTDLLDGSEVDTPSAPTLSTVNFLQSDGTTTPRLRVELPAPSAVQVSNGGSVEIEYKKTADSTWIPWQTAPGSATEDFITDVLAGVSYDVRIRHRNTFGARSLYSSTATATVATDTTAPAKPTGLAASGVAGGVVLEWDDNTEPDLSEYQVWRRLASEANDVSGAALIWTGRASAWVDQTGTNGVSYRFWIKAKDRTGNISVASDPSTAAPLNPPEKVATPTISFTPASYTSSSTTSTCTLASSTSGASIWYQIDGGSPALYSAPFSVSDGQFVFAWAEKSGMIQSDSAIDAYYSNL